MEDDELDDEEGTCALLEKTLIGLAVLYTSNHLKIPAKN